MPVKRLGQTKLAEWTINEFGRIKGWRIVDDTKYAKIVFGPGGAFEHLPSTEEYVSWLNKEASVKVEIDAIRKKFPPRMSREQRDDYDKQTKEFSRQQRECYQKQSEIRDKLFLEAEARSKTAIVPLRSQEGSRGYCLCKGAVYRFDRPDYSEEEMTLQVMELEDSERRRFERLRHQFSVARQEETMVKRERVSEEVRIAVWRRDEGKCAQCGNREKLEYDHIVPVSKGGSNTVRNIELLCETCNRKKGGAL